MSINVKIAKVYHRCWEAPDAKFNDVIKEGGGVKNESNKQPLRLLIHGQKGVVS